MSRIGIDKRSLVPSAAQRRIHDLLVKHPNECCAVTETAILHLSVPVHDLAEAEQFYWRGRLKRGNESAPGPSTVPLGTITVNGRLFSVTETRGYESYGAEIVEVTSQGVTRHIAVTRGRC
jgi:hypothetical protein